MKIVDVIRWVLLIPVTFISAVVAGVVCIFVGAAFGGFPIYGWTAFSAIAWVSASYFVAPSHRLPVVWVSFFWGVAYVSTAWDWWFSGSACVAGFLATMFYSRQVKQAEVRQHETLAINGKMRKNKEKCSEKTAFSRPK